MSLISIDNILKARETLKQSGLFVRTSMLQNVQNVFNMRGVRLHMKLENMQNLGSFKIRGVLNQMSRLPKGYGTKEKPLICTSAGNYAKAFSFLTNKMGLTATVIMPDTAPSNRIEMIKDNGVNVETMPISNIQQTIDERVAKNDMVYFQQDDISLIAGYASTGLEILEDVPDPDIILVCCGGGAHVSGVATAVKLSGKEDCRIYAVEPEGARTMYESYRQGRAVGMAVRSVAVGLAPSSAGVNSFNHCQKYVNDVLLVNDDEIIESMFFLHEKGVYVEPSGAAAFAALRHGKVPDTAGRNIVVVITGGNVIPEELVTLRQISDDGTANT